MSLESWPNLLKNTWRDFLDLEQDLGQLQQKAAGWKTEAGAERLLEQETIL